MLVAWTCSNFYMPLSPGNTIAEDDFRARYFL